MENIIEVDKINEVYLRIRNLNHGSAMELKEYLSCFIENHWFNPKVKAKQWDGRISFYDWNSQTIPLGLYPQFVKFCQKFGYSFHNNFNKSEMINEISEEEFELFYNTIFKDSTYSPRDYQDESIKKALRLKRGIIECATGSGKSLILYSIIRFLLGISDKKILLIVPNISLVTQFFNDCKDYGWNNVESYYSLIFNNSKKINWNLPVIISTYQSMVKKNSDFFEQFGAVIIDEAHTVPSVSISSILKKCINAEYRIGVTGTIPDALISQFTIYGYLGPKIFSLTSSELIDKGVLSKIKIANLLIQYPKETVYSFWHDEDGSIVKTDYNDELDLIYNSSDRNSIFKYIINKIDKTQNILILCHKICHLKDIKKYLEENFKNHKIYEIYGKTEAEERERIRKLANIQESTIILGTFATMSTGLNIPRLHHIIFASSYRSKIKILQSIGRGLRNHESKSKLLIWDIVDDLSWTNDWGDKQVLHLNHVFKHWCERLHIYDKQKFEYLSKKINISDINT